MRTSLVFRPTFNYLEEVYQDCLKKHINNSRYRDLRHTLSDINNGTKVLESDEQVNAYIAFYGAQHYYKLFRAFENLNLFNFVGKSLEIITPGSLIFFGVREIV
jgi:hypothetical protein